MDLVPYKEKYPSPPVEFRDLGSESGVTGESMQGLEQKTGSIK